MNCAKCDSLCRVFSVPGLGCMEFICTNRSCRHVQSAVSTADGATYAWDDDDEEDFRTY